MTGLARAAGALALVLLAGGCARIVEAHDACETFVHRDTPPLSPVLRRGADGTVELLVEVAATDEGRAILAAAREAPVSVQVFPSERAVRVLRVEGDTLVVGANSIEHAAMAMDTLCISPGDP